ncbi:MAG TPA: hypothetical protein DDW27_00250 [Bacteroidales bacterium]|nr:hypothetical protein [Bacteroidales bacterium]
MEKSSSLRKDYPKEVPLIDELLRSMARVEAEQKILKCQVNAFIGYHNACARAAGKLIEDLSKCQKL